MSNAITGTVSAGGAIFNDYTLKVEDIPGGHRLTITRGSEVQIVDIMDHDLTIDGGQPGQYIGYNEAGNAVPMDLPETGTLYINLTAVEGEANRYTADKTRDEVVAAHEAGRLVCCMLDDEVLPLLQIYRVKVTDEISVINFIRFVRYAGGAFKTVTFYDETKVYSEALGIVATVDGAPVVLPSPSVNAGKLYYADPDGQLATVEVGKGLQLVNGVLSVSN